MYWAWFLYFTKDALRCLLFAEILIKNAEQRKSTIYLLRIIQASLKDKCDIKELQFYFKNGVTIQFITEFSYAGLELP